MGQNHQNAAAVSAGLAEEAIRTTSRWAVRAPFLFSCVAIVVAIGATTVGVVWANGQSSDAWSDERVRKLVRQVLEEHPRLARAMTREEFTEAIAERDKTLGPATNVALAKIEAKLDAILASEVGSRQELREHITDLRHRVDQLYSLVAGKVDPPK